MKTSSTSMPNDCYVSRFLQACCSGGWSGGPQYTSDNHLSGQRVSEWIYLSTGLGMNYSPQAADHRHVPPTYLCRSGLL